MSVRHATKAEVWEYIRFMSRNGDKHKRMILSIMIELVDAGYSDFLLLRDEEVGVWWKDTVAKAEKTLNKYYQDFYNYSVLFSAYSQLTPAERKLIDLRKPTEPKKPHPNAFEYHYIIETEDQQNGS